jgi:hypothetical protein
VPKLSSHPTGRAGRGPSFFWRFGGLINFVLLFLFVFLNLFLALLPRW